ncbi:hypothetical protein TRIUR3_06373 [Triticum urartu]|uniref:Uncharacterized protein n=1 Tax=Triticum urartu TaxID=4572 RepID=M7ZTT9_TRIUA|nr:hypothetical protein TRIUR3_06373 [Triticum urartu]
MDDGSTEFVGAPTLVRKAETIARRERSVRIVAVKGVALKEAIDLDFAAHVICLAGEKRKEESSAGGDQITRRDGGVLLLPSGGGGWASGRGGTLVDRHDKFPCHSATVSGVFLAEKLNTFLGQNWKSFSSQNYFDPQGLFISVMWSGPLLLITILILVNTLVTLCMLMVRWKRAELKHRAREARSKQE